MDQFLRDQNRDTILVVNEIHPRSLALFTEAIKKCEEIVGRKLKVLVLTDKRDKVARQQKILKGFEQIVCNTSSLIQLEKALLPYLEKLLVIVCRSEKAIPYFGNIIPHVPYLETPTEKSLKWASDKIDMRRRLRSYNKKISPAYTIVEDASRESIDKIKKKVGFPLMVKPAGLAASVLVQVCYHEEELEEVLKTTFRKAKSVYKDRGRVTTTPVVLVEEFLEGDLYSTDVYVNSRGTMYTTPLVNVVTGFSAGQRDFFGYRQMTPVNLKAHKHQAGFDVAKEGVKALGLRSTTVHVELIKTEDGWKVVEVGARVGGFREFLYEKAFGIDHALNDLLIRMPMRPIIPRKSKGFAAVLKMYPSSEGVIKSIQGVKKVRELASFEAIDYNKAVGDKAVFARHGGVSVLDIHLFNKKRSDLLADIRRIEQAVDIKVEKTRQTKVPKLVSKTAEALGIGAEG